MASNAWPGSLPGWRACGQLMGMDVTRGPRIRETRAQNEHVLTRERGILRATRRVFHPSLAEAGRNEDSRAKVTNPQPPMAFSGSRRKYE